MWPFVQDVKSLPSLAAAAGFFDETKLVEVTHTFERIAHRAGTSAYHGNVLTSDWLNLFRCLANKKSVARHVRMSIENFRSFEALASYEMDENDWERFLLRDASMFFIIVLQETLVCYRNSFDLSSLISELLTSPRSSRLFGVFAKFFNDSSQKFLEEFSYCALFYLAMSQTSKYQWRQWSAYKELPEGTFEVLINESAEPEALNLRKAILKRLTLTGCLNKLFLKKKIETLASDEMKEIRRQYEFTLCVLEPENSENYKSLIRTLALCSNDSHGDRVKSWLEQRARYDSRLEDVDWDDDGQWESVDEDEEPTVKLNHIIYWNKLSHKMTQRRFVDAMNLLDKLGTLTEASEDAELRSMIWGYVASQTNDRDLLKRGQRLLVDAAKNHPIANYWLAEMNFRLSAYAEASRFLNEAQFELVAIPYTQDYLKPSNEKEYRSRVDQLKLLLQIPPRPDYVCCREICDSREVYRNSLEFNGLAQVACGSDCVLHFHADCWKIVTQKSSVVQYKHGLGAPCFTPDCSGRVTLVKLFNSKMHLTKEYRWTNTVESSPASSSNVDDDVLEALRVTIHQIKNHLSESEIVAFCEEFSNDDSGVISSFVESCLEDDQGPHPDWSRAQWLESLRSYFERAEESLDLDEINSSLASMVITQRVTADEIKSVEFQYAQLESELSELLNEETTLRNRQHESHGSLETNCLEKLENEIKEAERREADAQEAEAALKNLRRSADLKKSVLSSIVDKLTQTQAELSEQEAELASEGLKHHALQSERSGLLSTVKQNASEARANLRRALMELNETRYAIASDNLQAMERAIGSNLRRAEKQSDLEVRRLSAEARRKHFELMNQIVADLRNLEETTKAYTVKILDGRMDAAEVEVHEDRLKELLQRYSELPTLSVSIERPFLQRVAQSLD